jgi:signal transduction histidine kinase
MSRLLVAVMLAGASGLFSVAGLVAWRQRDGPAVNSFVAGCALAAAGGGVMAAGVALAWPDALVLGTAVIVGLLFPVPWLLLAVEYTGRGEVLSFSVTSAAVTPPVVGLAASVLIFGPQLVPGLRLPAPSAASGVVAAGIRLVEMVQWLGLLYAGGLMLVGSGLLLLTFQRYEHLDSTGGTLLGVYGTVPWLALLFGFQVDGTAPLALSGTVGAGFLIGGAGAVGAVGPRELFGTVPAAGGIGPATVVEELSDVIVVTAADGTVVELNDAAERRLGAARSVVGADVEAVLDRSVAALSDSKTVAVSTPTGRVLFEPTVSELTDQHGHLLGYAVVLRDVTDRTTRRQRLEVLNRVLRHNLRNDMNVISGRAKVLKRVLGERADGGQTGADGRDRDLAENVDAILRTGDRLVELSETSRTAERVTAATHHEEEIDIAALVEGAVETVTASYPDAVVEREVPAGVVVVGAREPLRVALEQLVENGVEHNDSEPPQVTVRAEYDPDWEYPLQVVVADDGPGLPEAERRVIEDGSETPMEHGSGLGLWVVRWATLRLGGTVEFGAGEPRGTVITLSLPRAHREAETRPDRQPADG